MAKDYGEWEEAVSLDEGGQSHVFLVKKKGDETTRYALKRLKNIKRLDRFQTEVNTLQQLKNRYIVEILDFRLEGSHPFYVMPFYANGNAIKAGMHRAADREKLRFFQHVLEGMAAAHKDGIVHRDLKPENILVTGEWEPVIADFGICFVEDGERYTLTDEKVGNRDFSAPEILEGRQESVSAKSDVYSLGKLLHWLLSGKVVPRERHRLSCDRIVLDPRDDFSVAPSCLFHLFVNRTAVLVEQPLTRKTCIPQPQT